MRRILAQWLIVLALLAAATVHAAANQTEMEAKQLIARWEAAFKAHDLDAIMALYAPDVLAYDVGGPPSHGEWRIVHDHVSVAADFATGKALLELTP